MQLTQSQTLNNRFVLAPYVNKGGLQSTVQHGIAMVSQKVTLQGLKVLVATKLSDGTVVPAGSLAFIREASLHSMPWAKATFTCESIEGQFILVDVNHVEFVAPPQ